MNRWIWLKFLFAHSKKNKRLKNMNEFPFYILRKPEPIWGDYDNILLSGMTAHLPRFGGLLQVERTGPFVPPISLPGINDIIITDQLKKKLENSGLTGFLFVPTIKTRIVYLEWEKWNKQASEPAEYPESGEPEDYILQRPHSPELAERMGNLWELKLEIHSSLQEVQTDFFRLTSDRFKYVSPEAKKWLEHEVEGYVQFRQVRK